jgi:3-methyladenine DNA glycosylase/8-oxoguanine DNA glycosylase
MKDFFVYKQIPLEETRKLAELEPRLAELINFDKSFNIRLMPDHFQCLIHTVISQQASNAAVDTI